MTNAAVTDDVGSQLKTQLTPWYQAVSRYPATAPLTRRFEFDPGAREPADRLLAGGPRRVYHELVTDQEGEVTALVARRILGGFLSRAGELSPGVTARTGHDAAAELAAVRDELGRVIDRVARLDDPHRNGVLRERAPLGLLGDCWLDTVSQPATQPAPLVNRLYAQHFANRGRGNPHEDQTHRRRRALEDRGVLLPHIAAPDFLQQARAHELTAWHGAFFLALSRLPASFLPELIGVHCAHHLLGIDDRLLGTAPAIADEDVVALLTDLLDSPDSAADPAGRAVLADRVRAGLRIGVALEREHVGLLGQLAEQLATMSLDAQVAAIIMRHAPYAGRQHGSVRVGGELLTTLLDPANFDAVAVLRQLRASRQFKPMRQGDPRFLRAIKFGGPMFGIFDEEEAAVFRRWAAAVQAGEQPDPDPRPVPLATAEAAAWQRAVSGREPDDVSFTGCADALDDRELFHRLVNIERYPNTLAVARARAERVLAQAEILFEHGAAGRYTDATYFDYSPQALLDRVEQIYWRKLVDPYQPLAEIPDADEVIFQQKTYALGSLIDGTWAHRIGNVGRFDQPSDQMLLSIYADEMGRGDLRKNHLTLIYRTLQSMAIEVPHIADPAFLTQGELPDELYGFSLFQLSLALFPDTRHDEILGYNLGIEMFGLGEMRMHEMQKLRRHGFDVCYEEAHLAIDNVSAGHARQSAEIIIAQLDSTLRVSGPSAVQQQWRRIWRGYAAFASFVEHRLVRSLGRPPSPVRATDVSATISATDVPTLIDVTELTI